MAKSKPQSPKGPGKKRKASGSPEPEKPRKTRSGATRGNSAGGPREAAVQDELLQQIAPPAGQASNQSGQHAAAPASAKQKSASIIAAKGQAQGLSPTGLPQGPSALEPHTKFLQFRNPKTHASNVPYRVLPDNAFQTPTGLTEAFGVYLQYWQDVERQYLSMMNDFEKRKFFDTRIRPDQLLEHEQIIRSIQSVTEAIVPEGTHTHVNGILEIGRVQTLEGLDEQIIRPRRAIFIPYIMNTIIEKTVEAGVTNLQLYAKPVEVNSAGHIVLAVVRLAPPPTSLPRIVLFDSMPEVLEQHRHKIFAKVKTFIKTSNWLFPAVATLDLPSRRPDPLFEADEVFPAARQTSGTSCGIHAILNAWCVAMMVKPNAGFIATPRFYQEATQVISLASTGCACWRLIYSFLTKGNPRSFGIPLKNGKCPRFQQTYDFGTMNKLNDYIDSIRPTEEIELHHLMSLQMRHAENVAKNGGPGLIHPAELAQLLNTKTEGRFVAQHDKERLAAYRSMVLEKWWEYETQGLIKKAEEPFGDGLGFKRMVVYGMAQADNSFNFWDPLKIQSYFLIWAASGGRMSTEEIQEAEIAAIIQQSVEAPQNTTTIDGAMLASWMDLGQLIDVPCPPLQYPGGPNG